ncbi:hypothetical protein HanIR_Chr07g0326201 [Helianthus annuus]|nr:hypothetical protein HanIR_Chr07g0326201 [Helianthus annuus]
MPPPLIRLRSSPCRLQDYDPSPRRYQPPLHCCISCLLLEYEIIQNHVSKIMD